MNIYTGFKDVPGDDLVGYWIKYRSEEDSAKALRVAVESEIAERMPGDDEGTVSKESKGLKITVTRKLSRKVESNYKEFMDDFPKDLNPIALKPSVDLKVLRAIEKANVTLATIAHKFITVKPAKPSVKITEIKKEEG